MYYWRARAVSLFVVIGVVWRVSRVLLVVFLRFLRLPELLPAFGAFMTRLVLRFLCVSNGRVRAVRVFELRAVSETQGKST